ncbi:energy-coupling factor transport system permease protein [Streptohalobacillus salinus]|uniref:Energy-coupling factor transport system permease protein n=1 Tax=Streptohalobacillus salinus TaxID=621096 RepID=A0A2V3W2C8_9BACI|nr:energy-coupling factor transporter transmembrane protein EcfT [Streptohalobacillus salinus]PXW88447.1 energy-coupling factor transport system permease protein [Streptohalobacillus salinus]
MNQLIFGRYFPGDSFIHHLDPRFKLIFALIYVGLLFFLESTFYYLLFFVLTLLLMEQTGVKLAIYVKGVKPLIWLILFAVTLRIMTTSGGDVYLRYGPFAISSFGLTLGLQTFLRFVMIIFISTVLTLTTKPVEITDALYFLLKPLKYIKVPIEDLSLMLSIALRFIPNLLDETDKVMNAQKARGMVFGQGSLINQMKALVPLVLPLFQNSLKRAEDMADVLEVKGYQSNQKRSHYRELKWKKQDVFGSLFLLMLMVVVFVFQQ